MMQASTISASSKTCTFSIMDNMFSLFLQYDLATFNNLSILWVLKNVVSVSVFASVCENFYSSVSEADAVCCRLLKSIQSTGKTEAEL